MKNILIIGAGGIGSFMLREFHQLYLNGVNGMDDIAFTIIDGDEVEEKNIRYQDYPNPTDLGKPKAEVMGERYSFSYEVKFIEKSNELDIYDIIILAVDNGKIRDLVYRHCHDKDKYFIDCRSEGRAFTTYTKEYMDKHGFKALSETYDIEKPSTSCQLKFELDNGIIQIGNRIVAMIGVQMLLNHLRGEKNTESITRRI